MRLFSSILLSSIVLVAVASFSAQGHQAGASGIVQPIFGFRDATAEAALEARFMAVPDLKLAEEHLRTLTQAPHMAGTAGDKGTMDYVAQKFSAARLATDTDQ